MENTNQKLAVTDSTKVLIDKDLLILQTQQLRAYKAKVIQLEQELEALKKLGLNDGNTTIVIGNNEGDIHIS